ncbi:MAG: DUF5131 family protein [Pirellulales bacterium]
MSDRSAIEWTDATWNPTRGCSRVSPGCANCYAEREAHRHDHPGGAYEGLTKQTKAGPRWTGRVIAAKHKLFEPLTWKRPRRIFVNSMSDLFHEDLPDDAIVDAFAVMAMNPRHTFQVLTKRADRMRKWFFLVRDGFETARRVGLRALDFTCQFVADGLTFTSSTGKIDRDGSTLPWPLPNVWLGVSVENQEWADKRVPDLLETPAAVRFLSCEPVLGPIDLANIRLPGAGFIDALEGLGHDGTEMDGYAYPALDWVIAGGESGPGARPMHPDWARTLRDQCAGAEIPFFFKQWGEWLPGDQEPPALAPHSLDKQHIRWIDVAGGVHKIGLVQKVEGHTLTMRVGKKAAGRLLDGRQHNEFPQPVPR